jgi:hypothetical protein
VTVNDRNPKGLKVNDRVRVVNPDHRDYGKSGVIVSLDGIADAAHGKARAHIRVSDGVFIHVSLGNLAREAARYDL